MNKRLELTNKTWLIIAIVIAVLVVLILILKPAKRDGDMKLTSRDGKTTITIEQIATEEATFEEGHIARCKINRTKDFFRSFVEDSDYFVGSVDSNGNFRAAEDKKDTGYFILLKDDHYFCLIKESGYALLKELVATVTLDEATYFMPFPCDVSLNATQAAEFDYISLTSVNSFEDLVAYYQRLKGDHSLVDDINKTITVSLSRDGEITQNKLVISLTETGIRVAPEE